MRAVIQRVSSARVETDGRTVGSCGRGLLILLGVARGDAEAQADRLLDKIVRLRVFADEDGRMNRSVADVDGELLIVPQFTLLADCRHGNRPDFLQAEAPAEAERLVERFAARAADRVRRVSRGTFGAHMLVSLVNDGPVTIVLDSADLPGGAAGAGIRSGT